jgi:hypothetical protein
MPCRDWEIIDRVHGEGKASADAEAGHAKLDIAKLKSRNTKLAQLLCAACKLIVEEGAREKMPKELSDWWWTHDKADRKRRK